MKIKILGTGGAINIGLPYNSFIINGDLLIETPPDIMNSLYREGIERQNISKIYISHFHADHCFGLPFLLLSNFNDGFRTTTKMIGPEGIEERVKEICTLAFGAEHKMQKWIREHIRYEEIENGNKIKIDAQCNLSPIKMFHSPETFGFTMETEGKKTVYIADTYWDDSLLEFIKDADSVLIDLNGEKSDEAKIHISESDLEQYALPNIKKKDIKFYGTHLKMNKKSKNGRIRYLLPGDEIEI